MTLAHHPLGGDRTEFVIVFNNQKFHNSIVTYPHTFRTSCDTHAHGRHRVRIWCALSEFPEFWA